MFFESTTEHKIYTVLTTDGSVGTVTLDRAPYPNEWIVIHTISEQGYPLRETKRFSKIISIEDL